MRIRRVPTEVRSKIAESMRRYHAERKAKGIPNPAIEHLREAMKQHWADPAKKERTRKAMSRGAKSAWADPAKHAERMAKRRATHAANGTRVGRPRKEIKE